MTGFNLKNLVVKRGCLQMITNYLKIISRFFKLGVNHKKYLSLLFFTSLLRNITFLIIPFFASRIIKYATIQDWKNTYISIAALAIAYLCYNLFHRFNYVMYAKNSNVTYTKLQEKVIDKVSTYDEEFVSKLPKSQIINTTAKDIWYVCSVADEIFDGTTYLIKLIFSILILFFVNTKIGILSVLATFVYINFVTVNSIIRHNYLLGQRKAQDKIADLFSQALDGNKEIKSFDMNEKLNEHLDGIKKVWEKQYLKKRVYWDRINVAPIILQMFKIFIYFLLLIALKNHEITIDILVLIIGYFETIESDCKNLKKRLNDLTVNDARIERLYHIFYYKSKDMMKFNDYQNDHILGTIDFKNVSFQYNDQKLLQNISFHIDEHKITAIVGKSGSGKSTIFRLLLRLYSLNEGLITIDDVNIYDYSKEVYTSNVSIATQKPFIFQMSIADNLGLVDSNKEHQIEACKRVGIHDFIMSLPKGYHTILKEDAENISGGQKQLISLARTLLSKSEILLFDEVTSSLDPNTADHIAKVIKDLKKDHTIVMITHKPKLMKIADKILVIDKGKLVGNGKHKDLIQNNKYYQSLQKI